MTIKQTGIVDWLGIEKGTGHVNLTIIDDMDWNSEHEHLLLLEQKLNSYLAFIESGEVFDRLAQELGRKTPSSTPVKVSILAKFDVTPQARAFLAHASKTFEAAGFALVHRVVPLPS